MDSSLLVATWTQLFLFLFDLVFSSSFWSSFSSWNSWCSKCSWNDWYWTNEKDCSIRLVWNFLWSIRLRVYVWCCWILASWLILSNNPTRATLWNRATCLIVGLRSFIMILITALSSKTHEIAPGPECVVFDGMWSMLVDVLELRCKYACFASQLSTGFPITFSWVHLFSSVRNEIRESPNPRKWQLEYNPCVNLHREKWF